MKTKGSTLLALAFSLHVATSGASDVNDSCEQNIENIYPSLPDVSQTFTSRQGKAQVQESIKGSANLTNKAYSNEIKDIKVHYPAGSYDPGSMVRLGLPYGGIEFKSRLKQSGRECLILTYELKFDKNFDFVKGGKLPGLYGGTGNTGGKIPNGHDGFSTRYIWKENGVGAIYAYLPTSKTWGTAIGLGSWTFSVGRWHVLEQLVKLNTPGQADGVISIWYDRKLVHSETGLIFRDTKNLTIDGLLFSTFFGGNNASFATPASTNIRFRNFVMSSRRIANTSGQGAGN
ncbi:MULTISPECIES: polysaccharide lyase [Gammaproteobacteria]|uniref:Polysaccharide lyase n=1 Tax=Pseudomonas lini TaxID=163011 RepID=A0A423IMX3_9PSED|nr:MULTISPECIES: polysaccharide lyase [Gammaproteobacteria]MBK5300696.1 hypothetical protein [Bacillus sp. TH86]MBK5309502.1 polysaccharide lyase [Pseudomonas sp. TH71]MBK5320465.1 hypothetical protein [Bacillus sp. TH59]MBK5335415.1 hypothetical protein [Bacillus sp. TH57]MBK5368706.1 polysaccharide lyase [Pseudomonas sp. TH40]MBK5379875.1 polysaccharide lyase [Pseudomonas sp. TH35]MBK5385334.1 polysaccharide lyase [Pseudomonas sp. TH38]MBK5402629.1 polysaccharide lyase [Pseudomonas sp. TH